MDFKWLSGIVEKHSGEVTADTYEYSIYSAEATTKPNLQDRENMNVKVDGKYLKVRTTGTPPLGTNEVLVGS